MAHPLPSDFPPNPELDKMVRRTGSLIRKMHKFLNKNYTVGSLPDLPNFKSLKEHVWISYDNSHAIKNAVEILTGHDTTLNKKEALQRVMSKVSLGDLIIVAHADPNNYWRDLKRPIKSLLSNEEEGFSADQQFLIQYVEELSKAYQSTPYNKWKAFSAVKEPQEQEKQESARQAFLIGLALIPTLTDILGAYEKYASQKFRGALAPAVLGGIKELEKILEVGNRLSQHCEESLPIKRPLSEVLKDAEADEVLQEDISPEARQRFAFLDPEGLGSLQALNELEAQVAEKFKSSQLEDIYKALKWLLDQLKAWWKNYTENRTPDHSKNGSLEGSETSSDRSPSPVPSSASDSEEGGLSRASSEEDISSRKEEVPVV